MKVTKKELILKSIQKYLFFGFGDRYSAKNSIVIDDTLVKRVFIPSENVILPVSWTFAAASELDTYLMNTLLPWVLQL